MCSVADGGMRSRAASAVKAPVALGLRSSIHPSVLYRTMTTVLCHVALISLIYRYGVSTELDCERTLASDMHPNVSRDDCERRLLSSRDQRLKYLPST